MSTNDAADAIRKAGAALPILADVVTLFEGLFAPGAERDQAERDAASFLRGEHTNPMVEVRLSDLHYAAVALASSADNGDRFVARRFLEAMGKTKEQIATYFEPVEPEPTKADVITIPKAEWDTVIAETDAAAFERGQRSGGVWQDGYNEGQNDARSQVTASEEEVFVTEQEVDLNLRFLLVELDERFAQYADGTGASFAVPRAYYDEQLRRRGIVTADLRGH